MARGKMRRHKKTGLPPGSLVFVGESKVERPHATAIQYDAERIDERAISVNAIAGLEIGQGVTWLNIDGVSDPELIRAVGAKFGLHALTMEDILSTDQRPRREELGEYLYLVLKMIYLDGDRELISEQVSLVLGKGFVLSFQEQEREGDVFNYVRDRLRKSTGKIRQLGPDYLLYSLVDAIVDNYFVVLEDLGERIEKIESLIVSDPAPGVLKEMYALKRMTLSLRRNVWPLREALAGLRRAETELIQPTTDVYLQDVYGHTIHVIDTVEIMRESLSTMLEIYLSSVSNRLNTVMKFLTLIATVFMPLTFIAGVYGMNFKFMPELEWQYGYPAVILIMALLGIGMVVFFRRRNWI